MPRSSTDRAPGWDPHSINRTKHYEPDEDAHIAPSDFDGLVDLAGGLGLKDGPAAAPTRKINDLAHATRAAPGSEAKQREAQVAYAAQQQQMQLQAAQMAAYQQAAAQQQQLLYAQQQQMMMMQQAQAYAAQQQAYAAQQRPQQPPKKPQEPPRR